MILFGDWRVVLELGLEVVTITNIFWERLKPFMYWVFDPGSV